MSGRDAVKTQVRHDAEAIRRCANIGIPAIMGDRSAIDLRQSPTVTAIAAKPPSSMRYIYTDGRKHPDTDDYDPTTNGHLVERYRLLAGGNRLSVVFSWEDPKMFQKPHTYEFKYYRIDRIAQPRMYNCNPNDPERAKFLLEGLEN